MTGKSPNVRIVQRSVVKPAAPAPERWVYLSAVDIMWRQYAHNRRLLFYKLDGGDKEYSMVRGKLQESLSLVLAHFYPLAGRLRDNCGRLQLECTDEGVELVEAVVEGISFEELQRTDFEDTQPLFMDLTPWIKPQDYCTAFPLCIQISRFECGSFVLGLAHSHVVCDGNSLWHFMTSWAECTRGESISLAPVHTRTILQVERPSKEIAFLQVEGVQDDAEGPSGGEVEHKLKLFQFSREMVSRMKQKAGGQWTSHEVMCAHMWKHVTLARRHQRETKVCVINVVNMRKRLKPWLPEGYFGNALMWTTCVAMAGELQDEDLAATAERIHASVASCDEGAFKGWMHWLEIHDRDAIFERCIVLNGARLRASSSLRFPVFEVDFGWGPPRAIRVPCMELPGKIVFFAGSDGYGSIDASLGLPLTVTGTLENDSAFVEP